MSEGFKCENCGHIHAPVKKKREKPSPETKEIIQKYIELFNERYGSDPEINWAACTIATKKLLKTRTKETLELKLKDYLNSEDSFFKLAGYRYLLFPAWLQKEVVKETTTKLCTVKSNKNVALL